ncbi:IQ domain-containing protein D, partial [Phoenicopterus ruber ruber]
ITLGAMKMLDPRRLKPDSIETERIITVLDETIAKLEMSSLIPHIIDSLDMFADTLGPEITNNLTEHQKLSNEMEHLLSGSEEGDAMRAEEQRGSLCLLEQRLKCSVRNILRLLLANPSLCQALKYKAWARESPAEVFIQAFGEFRNFMLERLLTSPVEEEEKIQFMEDISLQIKKNTEAITALQAELAAAIWTREEEVCTLSCVPQTVTLSLTQSSREPRGSHQFLALSPVAVPVGLGMACSLSAFIHRLTEEQECPMRIPKPGQTKLQVPARSLSCFVFQRKCRVETEIVNWIEKYDADMGEKQAEYEEVQAAYAEEKAQLSLLTEKHAVLLQEYSQIEEERRINEKKKEQALKEFNTMTLAATRIQAFWRGYLVRSLFKSKRKKKKKGKGK